jgi:diguanylate cyclase (GGDEF)-like protein
MPLLNHVLIVEDSRSVRDLLAAHVEEIEGVDFVTAASLAEAQEILNKDSSLFLCAVLDLNLPDAPDGEIVDLVQKFDIPVIVLTGSLDKAVKQTMNAKLIVEYVIKRNLDELEYVISLIKNIFNNQFAKVLVVDDSPSFRLYLAMLLRHFRYSVLLASDGEEALALINENPDISLIITDYNMPKMNGLKLIEEVRKNYKREDLAILGLSIVANKELTVQLLKTGANDYMTKPIMVDEFYCRVSQSVNMVRNVRTIKESSTTDFLTKVSNRRSLFDSGKVLYENARRGTLHIAMAMIDADFFKKVNDTYGHDAGDKLLIALARTLKHTVRPTDIVARFGGEEFVCIAVINKPEDAAEVFERVRCEIEALTVTFGEHYLNVTMSIGVTTALCDSFEGMLKRADRALYRAKEGGRNCVVVD